MKYEKVKPAALHKLLGRVFELTEIDTEDGKIVRVHLTSQASEEDLLIKYQDYSGLELLLPAPPVMVERFRLHGEVGELRIDQLFALECEAQEAQRQIRGGEELKIKAVAIPQELA